MCDTIVALSSATKNGTTLFGKNSDREPNEVQNIKIYPRKHYSPSEMVQCTYRSIPQVAETASILLCQPFWMFGGEMGSNEYGVVIGNEALFTREKPSPTGLTGMDLLRLALEQSRTAKQAVETIVNLLEKYGQGGNCGYRKRLFYMNGFLIADQREAYVLETVGSWWAWKHIKDFGTISNIISLEKDFDECSPGLIENAIKKGYCKSKAEFDFRKCYSDKFMTWSTKGRQREARSRTMLSQKKGGLNSADFMAILRDHGENPNYAPHKNGGTICMHAANKLIRPNQSVCSLVGDIGRDRQLYWTTGAANPCMSPYYPIYFPGTTTPAGYFEGSAQYETKAFWWKSEKLHRRALWHFTAALNSIQPQIKRYEEEMISRIEGGQVPLSQDIIDKYFAKASTTINNWGQMLDELEPTRPGWFFRRYWQHYNETDGII